MPNHTKPPRLGIIILSFFASEADFPEIAGDLSEEFHERVGTGGATAAQRWYLWEAFRNVSTLAQRQFARSPIQTLAMSVACLLVLNLPPFLALFEIHHRRLPNLEWSTFAFLCITYFFLTPPLLGFMASRLLPNGAGAVAVAFATLNVLGGALRFCNYFLLEPFVSHPTHWHWAWAMTGFSAAILYTRNRRDASIQTTT